MTDMTTNTPSAHISEQLVVDLGELLYQRALTYYKHINFSDPSGGIVTTKHALEVYTHIARVIVELLKSKSETFVLDQPTHTLKSWIGIVMGDQAADIIVDKYLNTKNKIVTEDGSSEYDLNYESWKRQQSIFDWNINCELVSKPFEKFKKRYKKRNNKYYVI